MTLAPARKLLYIKFALGVVFVGVLLGLTYMLRLRLWERIDWALTFGQLDFAHPYLRQGEGYGFRTMAWTLAFLPHALLPMEWGSAVNLMLNISVPALVLWQRKAPWAAAALAYTNPFFWMLLQVNNIDWIPALALALPPSWGMLAASTKPQVLGGMALIWLKQAWERAGWTAALRLCGPVLVAALVSLVIWPGWPAALLSASRLSLGDPADMSAFPFSLPLGAWLLWQAWKKDSPELAGVATVCFAPYFGSYSLSVVFLALAVKFPREGWILWVASWWWVFGNPRT